jgi:hypothetical protein
MTGSSSPAPPADIRGSMRSRLSSAGALGFGAPSSGSSVTLNASSIRLRIRRSWTTL